MGRKSGLGLLQVILLLVAGAILWGMTFTVGNYPHGWESRQNAKSLTRELTSLTFAVRESLTHGNSLPTGTFAPDSPVVVDKIVPFMGGVSTVKALIISAEPPMERISSPDCLPTMCFVGFKGHWLLTSSRESDPDGKYENYTMRALVERRGEGFGLFKNAKGERYDGGDIILMPCF